MNKTALNVQTPRDVLTPNALSLLQAVADAGSFAAAARQLGLVPSAVTYRVRQIEDALDVLLFDRSSRQAQLTEAGAELLREGGRLLEQIDAVSNRVRRVATGWEPQFTLAVDSVVSLSTVMDLVQAFYDQEPPTRLRIRNETLSGTLEALTSGQADLALGIPIEPGGATGLQTREMGELHFVYAVAPHHPLASGAEPLTDDMLRRHRAVAAADSVPRGGGLTIGLMAGQDVLTVPTMHAKLEAQLRGLGGGFVPEPMARPHVKAGRLVLRQVDRSARTGRMHYAWRSPSMGPGRALQWWLGQLESGATRQALLHRHDGGW